MDYLSIGRKAYRLAQGTKAIIANIPRLGSLISDPARSRSYFPERKRKPWLRIYFENLSWLLRHMEVNAFYYAYGFDTEDGPRQDEYMPYRAFRSICDDTNRRCAFMKHPLDYRCLLVDKFAFAQYLTSLGFPTPRTLALCDGKVITWTQSGKSGPYKSIFDHQPLDCFYKDLVGENGRHVYALTVKNNTILLSGQEVTVEELRNRIKGPSLLQERLVQHSKMAAVYPNSVNTIRLLTIVVDGRPVPFSAFVRFGANGNISDNWAIGGILGAMDMNTGKLAKDFFFKPGYGGRAQRHPNTGFVLGEIEVPFHRAAIEMATRLHRFFYGVHSIGWDIAITESGPSFIEGNDNWEITPFQVYEGGLKSRFLATLPKPDAKC